MNATTETVHKEFDGKKARIPQPNPGWSQPFAGRIATLKWAGWADQYEVYVDGGYLCRASAAELAPSIIS